MADELRVNDVLSIPIGEIELRASRSSGPGGQHANVTASRVEAVFDVRASATLDESQRERLLRRAGPVVTAVAQEARGQARNRELALERLAERLAAGARRAAAAPPDQAEPRGAAAAARAQAPGRRAQARAAAAERRRRMKLCRSGAYGMT